MVFLPLVPWCGDTRCASGCTLDGIVGDINSKFHLSDIRVSWNEFYRTHPNPTRQDVLDHVTHVDDKLGNWFSPRIR